MLTRLEIDGFKSFEALQVDLLPFTVVLGNNAAGKSNLFDAIQLLSRLATQDVAEACKGMRGEPLELFRQVAGGERVRQIRLAAEVLVDPVVRDPWGSEVTLSHTRIRYEVTLERREIRGMERIQVAQESAKPILRKEDRWAERVQPSAGFRLRHLRYARTKAWLSTDGEADRRAFSLHQDGKSGRNRSWSAATAEASVLYGVTNAEFPHLFALREEMKHWRLLQLDPALLRRPVAATAADTLDPDGANLAAVLAQLKAETASPQRPLGVLSDIAAELAELIPGVSRLDAALHEASREYRIELTMREGVPFSSRVISDGTLRILALLTLLHDPRHRGLVCFEEPENGVHPARIRPLVQRLKELVTMPARELPSEEIEAVDEQAPAPLCQLLLNSHSPVVLSALIDRNRQVTEGLLLFADTSTVVEPGGAASRRRTRLRPVRAQFQTALFAEASHGQVSDLEVQRILETVSEEG